ncbi:hypothetical protein KZP23_05375 [Echinicola marina]|uniref:hypothetical protein n=1 Tax=Echinicola marina TaxID=2859768 RepID=UPI001CF6FEE9|nr:hypothetical protein [Echinicola marina]UCS94457.1 hypothetical protein KZP23_05375 [Echinicola marina]
MTKVVPMLIEDQCIIQLSQLSIDQQNDLRSFLPQNSVKKINFQGIELTDCIEFETYEYWLNIAQLDQNSAYTIWDL